MQERYKTIFKSAFESMLNSSIASCLIIFSIVCLVRYMLAYSL